ncbi:MAG: tRNA adenosine(34) deaminase TadA [Schwartzia sp.]|jgi:tRNA(adenine34) deaminase|nr:tRNA adenosine(34) deaminase TadA [Schwartzia sp. (in: firmicutes)]
MNKDREYMAIALDEARLAMESGEVPVGAVLIDDEGGVVVRAHNMCEAERDATAHAEILAIREAGRKLTRWRLTGCTLYVTLEPCPMCAGAIMSARISRLVYGATDARAGAVESIFNIPGHPSLAPSPIITAGVMEDECKALLQSFFAARR